MATGSPINQQAITRDSSTWVSQAHTVERLVANNALVSLSTDDTCVWAGPPFYDKSPNFIEQLTPIGSTTGFSFAESTGLTYTPVLGSGRHLPFRSKSPVQLSLQRFMVRGRSLIRALMSYYVQQQLDVSKFDVPAALNATDADWANLQSEMAYLPFGLALIGRDKARGTIFSYYVNMCMLASRQFQVQAGSPYTMDSVSIIGDQAIVFDASTLLTRSTSPNGSPQGNAGAVDGDAALQSKILQLGGGSGGLDSYNPDITTR